MYSELNQLFFKVPKGFNEFQRATKTSQHLSVLFCVSRFLVERICLACFDIFVKNKLTKRETKKLEKKLKQEAEGRKVAFFGFTHSSHSFQWFICHFPVS